ncbi:MAG: hypothetical protein ACLFP6_01740 [Spirochaetaceae bacterium]
MRGSAEQLLDTPLRLPASYLLTRLGVTYCNQRSIPLRDIVTEDLRKGSGFAWKQVNLDFIQKLVTYGLIDEIELRRSEFTAKREELLRLIREICYGMLRRRYRSALNASLQEVEQVSQLMAHPSISIDSKGARKIDPGLITRTLETYREQIAELRDSVFTRSSDILRGDTVFLEEKERFLKRVLSTIDEETWFILFVVDYRSGKVEATEALLETTRRFLRRTTIAEYGALIFSELITIAEHAFLKNLAERDAYMRTHPEALESRLADPEFRSKLAARAELSGEPMTVSCRFEVHPYSPEHESSVKIRIKNRGLIGYKSRKDVTGKSGRRLRRESLSDLIEQDTGGDLGATLLGLYLDALTEAAEAEGAQVSTEVTRDERADQTVTELTLRL